MAVQIKGKSFTYSDTGLLALRLRYFCDSEDDAIFGVPASYRGLVRRGSNGGTWSPDDEKWIVDATYQGLADGKQPSEDLEQYDIGGEFREEPIESFPDRALLIANYGAYIDPGDGRLKFPEKLPEKKRGSSSSRRASAQNPLFGLTTYPVHYEVASHTYIRTSVPARVHNETGSIRASLPAGFSYDGNAKAWFTDAPTASKRGNAWTITERWKEIVVQLAHIEALQKLIQK